MIKRENDTVKGKKKSWRRKKTKTSEPKIK